MNLIEILFIGFSYALCVSGGVFLGALATQGRLTLRKTYPIVAPKPRFDQVTAEAALKQMALVNPNFDRTEYVKRVEDIPLTSTHPVELLGDKGKVNVFQGKVQK